MPLRSLLLMLIATPAIAAGPISKFDNKQPVAEYDASAAPGQIERCLIDMDGWLAPNVYKQNDRPDDTTIIWLAGGSGAGLAKARVDLHRTSSGTHIKSWMPAKQVEACAPR